MKLANKIQFELMKFVSAGSYEIIIPNFYYGMYEMDLFRLTNAGIVYEYEIKISRSDFFADFKKGHSTIDFDKPKIKVTEKCYRFQHTEIKKHDSFINKSCKCNRFFFVVPKDMVTVEEVPSYAGLLYFSNNWFDMVKNAPLIKKKEEINYQSLAKSLAFRSEIIRSKSNYWKRKFEATKTPV